MHTCLLMSSPQQNWADRKSKREMESIPKRIRNERQLNRQLELNGAARGIKKQIAQWQSELQELKQ